MAKIVQSELLSEYSQVSSGYPRLSDCSNLAENAPICFICCHHPLAFSSINSALSSKPDFRICIKPYSRDCKPSQDGKLEVLILDVCSVPNWGACFQEWQNERGTIIALIPPNSQSTNLGLQMVHLGAAGILMFTDNMAGELLQALHAIAEGHVWIERRTMDAYTNWTRSTLRSISIPGQPLTAREQQVLDLLQRNLSNRMIAQRLAISERTTKFHLSNILRKLNLRNRYEIQVRRCSSTNSPFLKPGLSIVEKNLCADPNRNA
jgi:DNA-binding NarL/FixJ family response regulator